MRQNSSAVAEPLSNSLRSRRAPTTAPAAKPACRSGPRRLRREGNRSRRQRSRRADGSQRRRPLATGARQKRAAADDAARPLATQRADGKAYFLDPCFVERGRRERLNHPALLPRRRLHPDWPPRRRKIGTRSRRRHCALEECERSRVSTA